MNTNEPTGNTFDASLRLQLRGLRRDLEPGADLWPGIQARIAAAPAVAKPRKPRNLAPWALAASLVLSLGIAWHMQPPPAPASGPAEVQLVHREADAMTREYRAALQEVQASAPLPVAGSPVQPALRELDRSARQIRKALDRDPAATYLLDRLQHTYTLRLDLTRRTVGHAAGLG